MSSEILAAQIHEASKKYTIYVSFIILIAGILGHSILFVILTTVKKFRKNSTTFYLRAESIVNICQLLVSFSSWIAINAFDNDLTRTSPVWCKFREWFVKTCTLLSLSIVCFEALDQYLSTSHLTFIRQLSSIKLSRYLIIIAASFWNLHGIIFLIFFQISNEGLCRVLNFHVSIYISYVYYLILSGLLPIVIAIAFAALAYTNVRRLVRRQIGVVRRRLEKQLTAMILGRVAFLGASILPFVIDQIYSLEVKIAPNEYLHRALIDLFGSISFSLFYLNFAVKKTNECFMFIYRTKAKVCFLFL